MKKKREATDAPVVRAALDLASALEEIEVLTARSAKVELSSRSELERAAEILRNAEAKHRELIRHLGALASAVDDLRARQNTSAATLSQHDERLAERRATYDALDRRFGYLAETARAIAIGEAREAPDSNGNGASDVDAMRSGVRGARDRLAAATDEARILALDAREAGFADLERQAHATRQQLASLLRKLGEALDR